MRWGKAPHIKIDDDQALVLFELLSRWFDDNGLPPEAHFADRAELAILSELLSQLQSRLNVPLAPDYLDRLAAARQRIGADWLDEFDGR